MPVKGSVIRVAGPVVEANGMAQAVMHEMVEVGNDRLIGEIIRLEGEQATIQVYQNTIWTQTGRASFRHRKPPVSGISSRNRWQRF